MPGNTGQSAPPLQCRASAGQVARELGIDYDLREVGLQALLTGLQDGSLDALAAALTVTAERETIVDFTHPFHTTGLAIAGPQKGSGVWTAVKRLWSWELLEGGGYDEPILQYLSSHQYSGQVQVLPNSFERQDYGIALPEGSELRAPINQKLLEVISEDSWQDLLERYLGQRGR